MKSYLSSPKLILIVNNITIYSTAYVKKAKQSEKLHVQPRCFFIYSPPTHPIKQDVLLILLHKYF